MNPFDVETSQKSGTGDGIFGPLALVAAPASIAEVASNLATSALAHRRMERLVVSSSAIQALALLGGSVVPLGLLLFARARQLRPFATTLLVASPLVVTAGLGLAAPVFLFLAARWCQIVGPAVAPLLVIGCFDAARARRGIPLAAAGSLGGDLAWSFLRRSASKQDVRAIVVLAAAMFVIAVLSMGLTLRGRPSPFAPSREPGAPAGRPAAILLIVGMVGFVASAWLSHFALESTRAWRILTAVTAVVVGVVLPALARVRVVPFVVMGLVPMAVLVHVLGLGRAAATFGFVVVAPFGAALEMEVASSARREGALVVAALCLCVGPLAALAG